jgi:ornithine cyclodeaminase/alanine dehydrogenase-like protein (mu-crystallin family)
MINEPSENESYNSTVFITDEDVAALADWPAAIKAITAAYQGPLKPDMVPPRTMARGDGIWLRSLCAVSPSGEMMGCKLIAASPKTGRAGYLVSLFNQETMALAALIDGNQMTTIRTAATSTAAIHLLGGDGALDVGIIGAGSIAKAHLEAILASSHVARVRVFSPTPASRERFVSSFQNSHRVDISAVSTPQDAVMGADVVICAARSRDESPVFYGEWLTPGVILISIGSTLPEQREVDVETMARADMVVADMPEEVLSDTGDVLRAIEAGHDIKAKTVSLADLASGTVTRQRHPEDIVIYKSVGSALQDIVLAEMLFHRARQSNAFTKLSKSILTRYR